MPANPDGMSALADLVVRARASRIWRETRKRDDLESQLQVVGAPAKTHITANKPAD